MTPMTEVERIAWQSSSQKNLTLTFSGDGITTFTVDNSGILNESMSLEQAISDGRLLFGSVFSNCFQVALFDDGTRYTGLTLDASISATLLSDGNYLLTSDGDYLIDENNDYLVSSEDVTYTRNLGTFKVFSDKLTSDGIYRELVCYDSLSDVLQEDYSEWHNQLEYPMTLKEYRNSFFSHVGIAQESITLPNDNMTVEKYHMQTYNGADLIGSILSIAGCFGYINLNGKFKYVIPRTTADVTISDGSYLQGSFAVEEYTTAVFTGVVFKGYSPADYLVGNESGSVLVFQSNPLLKAKVLSELNTVGNNLLASIASFSYTPSTITLPPYIGLEMGDIFSVETEKGTFTFPVLNRVLTGISALRDSYTANGSEYFKNNANNTGLELNIVQEQLDTVGANLDELSSKINNAGGLYYTEVEKQSGGSVTYYHNKPDLEESDIQLVISDVGITVTSNGTDANPTWYGLTVDGELIASIMNTIGINFDWGVGGELLITKNGNETLYVDADTGTVRINADSLSITGNSVSNIADSAASGALQSANNYTDTQLSDYRQIVDAALDDIQDQLDGVVDTYYYAYAPTTSNIPASDWTTEQLKKDHEGDLFLDTSTGKSYRWVKENNVWLWKEIPDTASSQALQIAQEAKDTADGKRRIFTAQPYPPYDEGDLWTQGSSGDIKVCTNSRSTGSYIASDWVLASKYTDDSYVESLETGIIAQHTTQIQANRDAIALKANSTDVYTKTDIDGKITQEVTDRNAAITVSANGIRNEVSQQISNSEQDMMDYTDSSIEQLADSISLTVSGSAGQTASIKLTVNGEEQTGSIDLTGVVTFTDLSTSGRTQINGGNITTGTISADRIGANTISVSKLTGSISNGNWKIDLDNGTLTIGSISANNISAGTLSATNGTSSFNLDSGRLDVGSFYALASGAIGGSNWSIEADGTANFKNAVTFGNSTTSSGGFSYTGGSINNSAKFDYLTIGSSTNSGGLSVYGDINVTNGQVYLPSPSTTWIKNVNNSTVTLQSYINSQIMDGVDIDDDTIKVNSSGALYSTCVKPSTLDSYVTKSSLSNLKLPSSIYNNVYTAEDSSGRTGKITMHSTGIVFECSASDAGVGLFWNSTNSRYYLNPMATSLNVDIGSSNNFRFRDIYLKGDIYLQGHTEALGTVKGGTISTTTLTTAGTIYRQASITLSAGSWIIMGGVAFNNMSTTTYRAVGINTSDSLANAVRVSAISGATTNLRTMACVEITSSTTYYLLSMSGTANTTIAAAAFNAIRIA